MEPDRTNRINRMIGSLDGVIRVCETDLASLKSAAIFLHDEIQRAETPWSDPMIEVFRVRINSLTAKTGEAIAALEKIEGLGETSPEEDARSEEEDLQEYLAEWPIAWQMWLEIKSKIEGVEVPDACVGQSAIMLTWDDQINYLECEVFSDRKIEFFYGNRKTDEKINASASINAIPSEILEKLGLFIERSGETSPEEPSDKSALENLHSLREKWHELGSVQSEGLEP